MASQVDSVLNYIELALHDLPAPFDLKRVEALTGVKRKIVAAGGLGVFMILLFFNIMGGLLSNFAGFLYPAYMSFKALETDDKQDDKQWLTYWTIFGFLNTIEYFSEWLLYFAPFYYLFKTASIVWLAHPKLRGAEFMYSRFVRQFLKKHEKEIDEELNYARKKAADSKAELSPETNKAD